MVLKIQKFFYYQGYNLENNIYLIKKRNSHEDSKKFYNHKFNKEFKKTLTNLKLTDTIITTVPE